MKQIMVRYEYDSGVRDYGAFWRVFWATVAIVAMASLYVTYMAYINESIKFTLLFMWQGLRSI